MKEIRVDISELKKEGGNLTKELVHFLNKPEHEAEMTGDRIVLKAEKLKKKHLRVLLRKFLHRNGLRQYFRVIRTPDNILVIKERRISEEE